MNRIKDENICVIIKDLGKYVKRNDIIAVTIISVICVLPLFFSNNLDVCKIGNLLVSILPSLLGITIAVYTILFGLDDAICRKLKSIPSLGEKPYEVLHATFVFGLIVQGFSLIVGILVDVLLNYKGAMFTELICWFLLFFSIIWTINMVLHLYALRTFR